MLTQRRVSYQLAEAVHADLMGAFDYLPARDIAVLRDWYDAPYSVQPDRRPLARHCQRS